MKRKNFIPLTLGIITIPTLTIIEYDSSKPSDVNFSPLNDGC
jgi:hypothetical protein